MTVDLKPSILTPDLLFRFVQDGASLKFVRLMTDIFIGSEKLYHKDICGCKKCQDAGVLLISPTRILVCGQSSGIEHLDLQGNEIKFLNSQSQEFLAEREITCGQMLVLMDQLATPMEAQVYYSLFAATIAKTHAQATVLYSRAV